jgi:uncharacterized repeat protein (TIGR03803 family)
MKKPVKQLLVMLALLTGIPLASAQTFIPLYSFTNGNDGAFPQAGLVQASDGNLYGTASEGGTNNLGTVFRINATGVLTTLYSFTGRDGDYPVAGLVQASDGNLYGTTQLGGTNYLGSWGTVFRITTNGALTTLYSFTNGQDGAYPAAGLVQASDGNLYGTTQYGGTNNDGTVFRFTTNGVLTPLYSFTGGNDGDNPEAGLVQAGDGNLYGTTTYGGIKNGIFGYGTIFRITTSGTLTPLYPFTNAYDGNHPVAGLVQANDGNLYGTTAGGGTNGFGAVFELTLSPPALNIVSANQSLLFWLGSNTNYVLQTTTNLASPNWVTVSNAVPAISVIVIVTNSLPAQYFRLANP